MDNNYCRKSIFKDSTTLAADIVKHYLNAYHESCDIVEQKRWQDARLLLDRPRIALDSYERLLRHKKEALEGVIR